MNLLRYRSLMPVVWSAMFVLFAGAAALLDQLVLLLVPFFVLTAYEGWVRPRTVLLLLLITLPFSVEVQVSKSLSMDLPDEAIMIFLAFIVTGYLIYDPTLLPPQLLRHPLFLLLVMAVFWTLVSALFAADIQIAMKFLLAKCWYLLAFLIAPLVFLRNEFHIRQAARLFLFSLAIVVLIVLCRHALRGFSFASVNEAVAPFFRNHVNYSAMLACSLPVVIAIGQLQKKRKRWLTGLALVIILAGLYFGFSRGAWLAVIAAAASWWLIRHRLMLVSFVLAVVVSAGFILWLRSGENYLRFAPDYQRTIFHPDFAEHLRATYRGRDISTAERFHRWVAGARMIPDRPLTGVGPNSFYYHYQEYALPVFRTWVSENPERSTVHNYFLLLAIEQGLPALIIFLLLTAAVWYYAEKLYHRIRNRFYRTLAITAGTIFSVVITLNLLSDLIETDKVGSFFFFCIAMLIIADLQSRGESDTSSHIKRVT